MMSVIGSNIARPSPVADALGALAGEKIDIIAMQHQIRNVDVQFVIDVAHYDVAVIVLHPALVESDEEDRQEQRAA